MVSLELWRIIVILLCSALLMDNTPIYIIIMPFYPIKFIRLISDYSRALINAVAKREVSHVRRHPRHRRLFYREC